MIVEIVGVKTKLIFGNYIYASGLGFKIFNTPVIIGLNWLFLTYTSTSIIDKFKINCFLKVIAASFLMIMYDLVMEQVAPKMDMWSWKNDIIPLQNYIAWFVFAIIFNSLIKIFKINTQNPLALIIFCSQFLFFVILLIYFQLVL